MGWDDPTAGLVRGETDVAFVWLPLPAEAGLACLYAHEGVVARPVAGLAPLAIAWRADDSRALVADFVTACRTAARTA